MTLTEQDAKTRRMLLDTAEKYGCAVIQIKEEPDAPPFAFTVGAFRRFGLAEAVIIGLPEDAANGVLNTYVDRASKGERFDFGVRYDGFLVDCAVTFERVALPFYPEYFGHAFLLYPNGDFPAVQIIASLPGDMWPWREDAPGGFAEWQPVLTDSGLPESWLPGETGP